MSAQSNVKTFRPREIMVDTHSPDPTNAINGFLWNMHRAREIGFAPSSEHMMAEHFLRGDVKLVFYSSAGGILSFAADEEALDSEDSFEMMQFMIERVAARRKAKREKAVTDAQGIEAPSGGETTQIGSTEGESPIREANAPITHHGSDRED
jgi:hypothetical protein